MSDFELCHPSTPTPFFNDNHVAVDWSHSFSTKGMGHLNIRENSVHEAQSLNEVAIAHIAGTCKVSKFQISTLY
jgi:hypothetical protein